MLVANNDRTPFAPSNVVGAVLNPGETCWRRERAHRAAVLIDNERYFAAVRSSIERAARSILIVGWHFDPRTSLGRRTSEDIRDSCIGEVLRRKSREQPRVDICVLVWDMSLLISMTRAFYPQRAQGWFDGAVRVCLDDQHPATACRHQKLVIVDGAVAFCSGSDFAVNRWDSAAHLDVDPRRRLPSGKIYAPRHAVSIVLDGPAAGALAELAAERWRQVSGQSLELGPSSSEEVWPEHVAPDLTEVELGVSRTEPHHADQPLVKEVRSLYLALVRAAQRLIYIEDQYFANTEVGEALAQRLTERHGPEIVVITSHEGATWFDRLSMDAPRDMLIRHLQASDHFGRFGVYSPLTASGDRILMHAKLTVVDDRLLRVGSANLNNRSMGLDSECDVVIDALASSDAEAVRRVEREIAAAQHRLLAAHLALAPSVVARLIKEHGGQHGAIRAAMRLGHPRLAPVEGRRPKGLRNLIARFHLGDPESPADVWRPWRRRQTCF